MNLDRALIKSQAKQLIKGNVFKFFVVIIVVTLLTQGGNIISSSVNVYDEISDATASSSSSSSSNGSGLNDVDEYDFDSFNNMDDFEDFAKSFGNETQPEPEEKKSGLGAITALGSSSYSGILFLFLAPLSITLVGVFYELIKGKNMSWNEEFEYVFSKTFNNNYWNKFLLNLLQSLFTALWSLLFIIPGIVYYYKVYFTSFIMVENPQLSWKEAITISKKMTDGHKGELFVLDLSFFGWYLLECITFGLAGIYVLPYVYTTKALYYENFKLRAFQLGMMSEYDFVSEKEKLAMAANNGAVPPQFNGTYQVPQQNTYQPPVQNAPFAQQNNIYQPVENPVSSYGETPAQQPVSEPVQEAPAIEQPVSEPIAEEAPAVEQPVSEPIAEEAPAAEQPASEPIAEETPTSNETPWEE